MLAVTHRIYLFIILLSLSSLSVAALSTLDGQQSNIETYTNQGKWTVVMLWASDCHICNIEAEQYIQFHEENKTQNIQVLGVSLDGQQKLSAAKAFVERHDVTFPNLIGELTEVVSLYEGLTGHMWVGTPTILVYNPAGKLLAAQPGAVPTTLIEEFIKKQATANSNTPVSQ